MNRLTVRLPWAIATASFMMIVWQGCASLEPLPRFFSQPSSLQQFTQHTPPPPAASTESIAEYSRIKEQALRKGSGQATSPIVQPVILPRASGEKASSKDELAIDGEEVNEESGDGNSIASGEDDNSDEPIADEEAVAKVVRGAMIKQKTDATHESNSAINRENMMLEIINMFGARYKFGGTNALGGIDCSAFVGTVFSRAVGIRLPRTSNAQFSLGRKVKKDHLLAGDLVFFKTRRRKKAPVSHVGIYVGENLFAHASRKRGVIISSLESNYYSKTYVGAKRVVGDELTLLKPE